MDIVGLMIDLGRAAEGARLLMNAIDSYREVRRDIEHELTREELYIERAIYSSARRLLKSSKKIVEGYAWMMSSDKRDLIEEFGRVADKMKKREEDVAGKLLETERE